MRLNGRRESSNVDDRRGRSGLGGKIAGGGIVGVIIAAVIAWISGGNPLDVITSQGGAMLQDGGQAEAYVPTQEDEELATFSRRILAGTEDVWGEIFRQNGLEISPEQWTVLIFLWEKDGVTQQELCNATFKDKPSMTRLIDNMERQHLVVRISDKKDRRTNLIHLTKDGKELEEKARIIAGQTLKEALHGITLEELSIGQEVLKKVFFNTRD